MVEASLIRRPSIVDAASRLIVSHGLSHAAEEAEKCAEEFAQSEGKRVAMLWRQVAIAIQTIQSETSTRDGGDHPAF